MTKERSVMTKRPTLEDLVFSARERCRCGCGLAYHKNQTDLFRGFWLCSYLWLNVPEVSLVRPSESIFDTGVFRAPNGTEHDGAFTFSLFNIKSEIEASYRGITTRPKGE
jgi:hypothetical protein